MGTRGERGQVSAEWVAETAKEIAARPELGIDPGVVERIAAQIPAGYDELNWPPTAAIDLAHLESMTRTGADVDTEVVHFVEDPDDVWRFRLYRRGQRIALAELLPLLDHLGLRAHDERSFSFPAPDGGEIWLHDIGVLAPAAFADPERRAMVEAAFVAQLSGEIELDGLNALVGAAGLSIRQVEVLRAYVRYVRQVGVPYGQRFIEQVCLRHAPIVDALLDRFAARLDPARATGSADGPVEVLALLDQVPSLDDDRTLRLILTLIEATLRTNAYQRDAAGLPRPVLAFKLDSAKIAELPLPRPMFEIWVCSPRVEGVHLRNGRIARGGIRWSDRSEDFRTEILGLVKAQIVKNAVIVPTGAKGGFVVKRPPVAAEEMRAEGVACYREFIGGLLDVTDNIVDGAVVAPADTVRHDGDDPYLVVAADKGTATFSDIANEIAVGRNFWLGDAFASGGSAGYDHKAMGITARGAWESVRRHARAIGKNADRDPLTIVGVGDMSGDVFGNGLLRSPHVSLLAAFDHRHVFIDPDPDPAASFAERQRLFQLPRSSWADYDPALISPGGGVYPRSLKSISLSARARQRLGVEAETMTPAEVISAVLRAPVDVLWNGGIGTYVKATAESNADVGDRANDAVRVNGAELRCRMVGEGGNLGFTQLGRIEYASTGGLINTDAIDNSAGVDCSDHEVNLKILLGASVAAGEMTTEQRNELLASMTDEVAELVLDDNQAQTLALAIARQQSPAMVNVHARYLNLLEREGWLNRGLEDLPTDKQLAERQAAGGGLTTPEFAVLMAYTKTSNSTELARSTLPDDLYLEPDLFRYFPKVIQQRFAERIRSHRLRREIVVTQISNQMSNLSGISFDHRMHEDTGAALVEIVRAWTAARDVLDVPAWWATIDELGTSVKLDTQLEMFLDLRHLVDRSTLWLLRNRRAPLDLATTVASLRGPLGRLASMDDLVRGRMRERMFSAEAGRIAAGVPERLAQRSVLWSVLHTGFDIADLAARRGVPVERVAGEYWQVFERLDLDWLWLAVGALPRSDRWQTQARAALRDDLLTALAALAGEADAAGSADAWIEANRGVVEQTSALFAELRRADAQNVTTLSVALRQLHNLSRLTASAPTPPAPSP